MLTNKKQKRGEKINQMTQSEIKAVVESLLKRKYIYQDKKTLLWVCTMVPNKNEGYAQTDVTGACKNGSQVTGKVLVHHLWFRYQNGFAKIKDNMEISHLNKSANILNVIEESWEMNQSRKYCHLFGWYKAFPNEENPRCPHKENPCRGDLEE